MGPRGAKGELGDQGLTGSDGVKGTKGAKGDTSELVSMTRRIQQLEELVRSHQQFFTLILGRGRETPASSCRNLSAIGAPSGVYWLRPGSQIFQAYCDQITDGGGWMLLYAYKHKGGENRALVKALTTDINGYSHEHLTNLGIKNGWANETRFYCTTSNHNRVLHFKTSNANVLKNAFMGGQHTTASDWSSGTIKLSGHTAYLPDATTHTSQPDGFVGRHPFYKAFHYHWTIRAYGRRFECDDYRNSFSKDTIHRVFVRN